MKVYVVMEEVKFTPTILGVFPDTPDGNAKADQVGGGTHVNRKSSFAASVIEEAELDIESLIRDCCDGETRDDIISNLAKSLEMPELLELI